MAIVRICFMHSLAWSKSYLKSFDDGQAAMLVVLALIVTYLVLVPVIWAIVDVAWYGVRGLTRVVLRWLWHLLHVPLYVTRILVNSSNAYEAAAVLVVVVGVLFFFREQIHSLEDSHWLKFGSSHRHHSHDKQHHEHHQQQHFRGHYERGDHHRHYQQNSQRQHGQSRPPHSHNHQQEQRRRFEQDFRWEQQRHQHHVDSKPPPEDLGQYYRTLMVKEGAPFEVVRRGYHRLSKEYHPDKTGGKGTAKFLEIQAAYEKLSNMQDAKAAHAGNT
mmetsp:Transcript_2402/g.4848  ORF Transcript_2402/g.4848 Transcript_2402/m.4848 type:complete len:273 (+) Transcript_2402:3-821(+)|eukprot:CAMPEP_0114282870 /NCGR_PEP_ID=MMETSP0059-20121206/3793_1 /TAXON_ID=36894 /ORGANISM="Pyramimonas parkeae, Strain CCMP726" /LENGTH=272 /DNA_ID=CAMNT_0001403549 /DNA_START=334 /DNA_END=1152 /DNA_ORIENTATION=-